MGHESAFKNGSLSHGYLISGEKGIGKLRFIERLSQSILCSESNELFTFCGKCNSCRTFERKSSPDFFLVQEEKGSNIIKIGQLRGNKQKKDEFEGIVEKIYETPLISSAKVFLINNAHLMNDESQNFLLKILEEPPKQTFIFLLSSAPFLLKKTLLSRLSHLQIKFPDFWVLKKYFQLKNLDLRESDYELIKGSDLISYADSDLNQLRESWDEFSNDLQRISSYKEIEKIVSRWDDDSIHEKLIWLSRMVISVFGAKLNINYSSYYFEDNNLKNKTFSELSEIFKTIQEILRDLNSGVKLNNKIQLKSLLLTMS